jgi:hypothetical protein
MRAASRFAAILVAATALAGPGSRGAIAAAQAASDGDCTIEGARFAGAEHAGQLDGGQILWRSRLFARHLSRDQTCRLSLAVPLPETVRLDPASPGAVARVDGSGRIEAIDLEGAGWRPETIDGETFEVRELRLVQALPELGRVQLGAPIAAGPAAQVVRLSGADAIHFEPQRELGIRRHVGFRAERDLHEASWERLDRLTDGASGGGPTRDPEQIYLTGGARLAATRGLVGTLSSWSDRTRSTLATIALLFLFAIAILSALYRGLTRTASRERAEAMLSAEFASLDKK